MGSVTPINEPTITSTGVMARRTVVVVDMVSYSAIANLLEENISANTVAELNRQIQSFMTRSLAEVPSNDYCTLARTGDGIIILFIHPEDAHGFSIRVHIFAKEHNQNRSLTTAERWFRIGIATGEVHTSACAGESLEYAGVAIANAVRLETAASPGEIVIDRPSHKALSSQSQALYSAEVIVKGKRKEKLPARRFCVTPRPLNDSAFSHPFFTRRAMITAGLSVVGAAVATVWARPIFLRAVLHPLPAKRSVVVMAWPTAPPGKSPLLSGLLDAIRAHLARVGRAIPELFVVRAEDSVDGQSVLPDSVATILTPKLVADSWGANLVLAAFIVEEKSASYLALNLLDPYENKTMRRDRIRIDPYDPEATTRSASAKAAELLDLPAIELNLSDTAELAKLAPANRALFDEASYLAKDENQTAIEEAITKFKNISVLVPDFALAYAETGNLLIRKYNKLHDKSLDEAAPLFDQALGLSPYSQRAKIGQARLLLAYGQPMPALRILSDELKSDPGNSDILLAQAEANGQLNLIPQELEVYREIIRLHPNFWPAQNDLGKALQHRADIGQGDIEAAGRCYERASELAPRAVIPLINLSTFYLQHDRTSDAEAVLKRAADIAPNPTLLENLGTMRFQVKDYKGALNFYQQALEIFPKGHYILSDIGDCYERLNQPEKTKDAYIHAADILAADLKINPLDGSSWMTLAFYEAKAGRSDTAEDDIRIAERRGATDVGSKFTKARALAQLGRLPEAKILVDYCRSHGISEADIELATELNSILPGNKRKPIRQ